MKGLRVFVGLERPEPCCEGSTFYTQRAGGPYYRWRYAQLDGRWLSCRVHVSDLPVTELVSTPWKGIPAALKKSLDEHYVD